VKFGVIPPYGSAPIESPDYAVAFARMVEELGFESLWTVEHVVVPVGYESEYPYSPTGKMPGDETAVIPDPILPLAYAAAVTKQIRLGTGIMILPQRHPAYVAKEFATLDVLSRGRALAGVGIGWLREEFDAMGVPFERRGARFDDYIQAMRKVWAGDVVEHQSDFVNWTGFKSYPLPVQKPGVPCIIGGSKGKVFERIAKHGDGWYAPTSKLDQLPPLLAELDAACKAVGRDRASVEISCMWIPAMEGLDTVKEYEELGVDRLIIPLQALGGSPLEALDELGSKMLSKMS